MIRPIMTKKFFLRQPSEPATVDDLAIMHDFKDRSRHIALGVRAWQ